MNRMTAEGIREFEKLALEVMKDGEARGIAVGITDGNGKIQYEKYFGWRDAENKLPIDKDTIFGMASVTKSFTALSIMQMQKDGILSVHDPVRKYIPEFTNKGREEEVRIWHLLCHSGGYFPLPRIVADRTAQDMGLEDSLDCELADRADFADRGVRLVAERLDEQTHFTGRPGQRMSYCNDGFGLLSDIVRRHSGCGSFAAYLDRRILKPLGMDRSNISFIRNTLDDNAAILYSREKGEWRMDRDYQNDAFVLHGGGGMKSTLGDMLQYAAMYLNRGRGMDGASVTDSYSIGEMCRPRQFIKPGVYYGYGLETKQMEDMTVIEHGGSLPGVSSSFSFSPQAGAGVVVLCNTMDVPVSAIADAAMRVYCGLPAEQPRISHFPYEWSGRERKELSGSYVSGEGDAFTLRAEEGGALAMKLNEKPVKLTPVYPWQGIVRKKYTDMYLTAIRDENGNVFAVRYGSRIFPKV